MVHEIVKVVSSNRIIVNDMEGVERKVIRFGEDVATELIFLKGDSNPTYGVDENTFYTIESCPGTDQTIFKQILSTFKKD